MTLFNPIINNTTATLHHLLNMLNIKHTKYYIYKTISDLPYNNTLYGISLFLNYYNIKTICRKYTNKRHVLNETQPFVIIYNQVLSIVATITPYKVHLTFNNRRIQIPLEEFISRWDGITLLLLKTDYSIEPNYKRHLTIGRIAKFKKYTGIATVLAITCFTAFYSPATTDWIWWASLLLNILGALIAFFSITTELDSSPHFINRLCNSNVSYSCETLTIFRNLSHFKIASLSEIGMGFFLVNIAFLLYASNYILMSPFFSLFTFPLSIWSIWYQRFKIKSWCVLCLSIVFILWAQCILSALIWRLHLNVNTLHITHIVIDIILYVLTLVLIILIINLTTRIFLKLKDSSYWHSDYNLLKAQSEVVRLYKTHKVYRVDNNNCSSIVFGYPKAENNITILSNPYCEPCAYMHTRLSHFFGQNFSIRYVFTYFSEDQIIISKHFIAAYIQLGAAKTWELMSLWFNGNQNKGLHFFDKYNLDIYSENIENELNKQHLWQTNKRLTATPAIFINGKELNMPYTIDDLIFLPL